MSKTALRVSVCIFVYIVFLFIFGSGLIERDLKIDMVDSQKESTFPVVYIKEDGNLVNLMHGYMSNINARYVRDGIVPIGEDNNCNFCIKEYDKDIKKVSYEISDTSGSQIVDAGTVKDFEKDDDYKNFVVSIHEQLSENTEYVLKMVLLNNDAEKMYYYTRIKKTNDENMGSIIKFAKDFHDKTIEKKDKDSIQQYLEVDPSKMNDRDFSYVNIHSGLDMVCFDKLKIDVVSDISTTIREVKSTNLDTISVVEFSYFAEAKTDSGVEKYKIEEGYRIRWTKDRIYLLFFERTMEAMFDPKLLSVSSGEFKIGITSKKGVSLVTNQDNSKMSFVRNGELWYYNNPINKMTKVFSFSPDKMDDIRDTYDEHDIKIVNMMDNGDTYFMVYGYMNRGSYEGQTCMTLYKFYAQEDRIEELVNLPVDVTYGMLKEQLSDFYFVSENNDFFFTLAKKIYCYDINKKNLEVIAKDILSDDMAMSKDGNFIAWQSKDDNYEKIHIMNLSTRSNNTINAKSGKCVKVLGTIRDSVVYGDADKNKVSELVDGTLVVPVNAVNISDEKGKVIKTYKQKNGYVTKIRTQGNRIILKKVKSSGNGKFIEIKDDCIYDRQIASVVEVTVKSRAVKKTKTEWYLKFPDTVTIAKVPELGKIKYTVTKEDKTVRIEENIMHDKHYYVYACHGLESGYEKASDAISQADSRMGMVVDNQGYIVWERGLADYASTNKELKIIKQNSNLNSVQACMKTMIVDSGATIADRDLKKEKGAITEILDKYLKGTSVNMVGTDIKYLQYLLTKKKPILAMDTASKAVLITGFDGSTITCVDMSSGSSSKMSYDSAKKKFAKVGSVYIGALK